jgi:hypothetical protein
MSKEGAEGMRGRFGRRRIFGGRSAAWLGGGALVIILALIARRHEKSSDAIRAAYRSVRERFGSPEQLVRHNTDLPSDQAGEVLVQEENPKAETEESPTEAEEGPSEEARGPTRESARPSEEGDGWEEESQGAESASAIEEGRSHTEGLPIDKYDSLSVSEVTQSLRELSLEEVEQLRDYEAENRNRRSIMQRFETRIRAARKNLEKRGNAETEGSPGE